MKIENFLAMSPRQAANSIRIRSRESKDKAINSLKILWADEHRRECHSQLLLKYWKGKVGSMKGVSGFKNKTSKAVVTPIGSFGSGLQAAKALGITSVGLRYRILAGWKGYGYEGSSVNDGSKHRPPGTASKERAKIKTPKKDGRKKSIQTPLGVFNSMQEAAIAHGFKDAQPLYVRLKRKEGGFQSF